MLSKSEVESIEIYEAFKHIGFGNNINMLSKKSRKVVKNNKRRVKFGKKKKKKTIEPGRKEKTYLLRLFEGKMMLGIKNKMSRKRISKESVIS